MIDGEIGPYGVPVISLRIDGRDWSAVIDTGFSGDLRLSDELLSVVDARYIGEVRSFLAGGQVIDKDNYRVWFPFDGRTVLAEATFVGGFEILIGTRFFKRYRLEIHFPKRTVQLKRSSQ